MAITTGIPTIKVAIHADGAPLQEHEDEDEVVTNDSEVTRYIEATTGQTFSININVGAGTQFVGDSFAFHVCVDGHMVDSTITRRTGETHTGSTVTSQGRYLAAGTVQKYRFADLDKSGDRNPTREEMEVFKQLGEIRIVAHHQIRRDTEAHVEAAPSQASGAVSERALKGQTVSHSVGFGEAEQYTGVDSTYWDADYIDPDMTPAAVYIFRYRSQDALKKMGILEDDDDAESESDDQTWNGFTPRSSLSAGQRPGYSRTETPELTQPEIRKKRKLAEQTITVIELDDDGEVRDTWDEKRARTEPTAIVDLME